MRNYDAPGARTSRPAQPAPTRRRCNARASAERRSRVAAACDELVALPPRGRIESHVLGLYLDGHSYTGTGEQLGCDCKTVDNALQRVKRKILQHQSGRQVLQ